MVCTLFTLLLVSAGVIPADGFQVQAEQQPRLHPYAASGFAFGTRGLGCEGETDSVGQLLRLVASLMLAK